MILIEDVSALLMMLGECVTISIDIAIAIVGSRSGGSCCCGVPVALEGKDVMVTKMLIEDLSTSLLMIKDC